MQDIRIAISHFEAGCVQVFRADSQGQLEQLSRFEMKGKPGPQLHVKQSGLLYVGDRENDGLCVYRIVDREYLIEFQKIDIDLNPVHMALSPGGNFLFACEYRRGLVASYALNPDGTVQNQAVAIEASEEHAHSVNFHERYPFFYVPHTLPINGIDVFHFDHATGFFERRIPIFHPPSEQGPRHGAFHPERDIFYTVNENASTVSVLEIDPLSGDLLEVQSISTLPLSCLEENTCAEIKLNADANMLYASNRGRDSIVGFSIDEVGALSHAFEVETEKRPRMFEIDPTGKWMLVAGESSNSLALYAVDPMGTLKLTSRVETEKAPLWVSFL